MVLRHCIGTLNAVGMGGWEQVGRVLLLSAILSLAAAFQRDTVLLLALQVPS